ncbi:hypothetical protein K432DRAFT_302812 [Lepidopterella palustris CBS 459.81]|uniref:C2H2-type domain-containing protein n=1 Tax=Lepidopterella palustris CBS 459.81 TaxID=1314670 RepID=A0A8E2E6G1_9PEZI|nr:hypothetical protein K432DRAFT_302812 [Lepidopterella palustris CBS 459.81]
MESLPNQNPLKPELVSKKQSKFIRKWYRDFVENQQFPLGDDEFLTADKISALAILIKLQPRTVHDWITKNLMGTNATVTSTEDHRYTWTSQRRAEETTALGLHPPQAQVTDDIQPLPDEILELIQNHERARNRVRTTSDGRRRVNRGKYECTFRCGYRTKNVFDWKRHEENHQPQNFWLCTVCRQSDQPIDFLVHRSDKLLKHAQEKHKGRDPKDILNTSKLDYIAGFKSPCGFCGHPFSSWEDRNKHILDHFDGQIGGETFDMTRWLDPWPQYEKDPEDECDEDSDSSSESSGSSGDDGPDKRDATGGSGGGSGVQGGGEASYKWFDALRGGRAANKGRGNYRGRGTMTRKCVLSMRGPPSDTPPEAMDDEVIRVSQSSHKPETCATSPLVRKAPRKGYSQKTVTIWPSNNSL